MTFPPISNWFEKSFDTPLIIAGPCSAENRQQVIDTALELAKLNRVHVLEQVFGNRVRDPEVSRVPEM